MPVEEQVCVLYAGTRGYLDKIAVEDVGRFEKSCCRELHAKHAGLLEPSAPRRRWTTEMEGRAEGRRSKPSPRPSPERTAEPPMASLKDMRNRIPA